MRPNDSEAVFTRALLVVNDSLAANRRFFPYRELFGAAEKFLGDRCITIHIYDDDPRTPVDTFTIRLQEGQFEKIQPGCREEDLVWKVSWEYLQRLIRDPVKYIDRPQRLEWDWLRTRIRRRKHVQSAETES